MDKIFTQDYLSLSLIEQEVSWWFDVYDNLPDDAFQGCDIQPSELSIIKIKGFVQAYQPTLLLRANEDVILN